MADDNDDARLETLMVIDPDLALQRRTCCEPLVSTHPDTQGPLEAALATVELPLHLNWSDPGHRYNLRDRRQRARVYEIVLREGTPQDVLTYIDGALLIDLWDELVLPHAVRERPGTPRSPTCP